MCINQRCSTPNLWAKSNSLLCVIRLLELPLGLKIWQGCVCGRGGGVGREEVVAPLPYCQIFGPDIMALHAGPGMQARWHRVLQPDRGMGMAQGLITACGHWAGAWGPVWLGDQLCTTHLANGAKSLNTIGIDHYPDHWSPLVKVQNF